MFEMGGTGVPLWEVNTEAGITDVAAAKTEDIFFGTSFDNYTAPNPAQFKISKYHAASSTPDWTYDGAADGYTWPAMGMVDPALTSEFMAVTPDGHTLAVGVLFNSLPAILFFHHDSAVPFAVYKHVNTLTDKTNTLQAVRISADGTKCVFHGGTIVYRVDVATGKLEGSWNVDAGSNCLAINADASIVVHGFQYVTVLDWTNNKFAVAWKYPLPTATAAVAKIGPDNDEIVAGLRQDNVLNTMVLRFKKSAGPHPIWSYSTPKGDGSYQDLPTSMAMSADGQWIVVGTWGTYDKVFPEVYVLNDYAPKEPFFTMEMMGSVWSVDMTLDGSHIAAASKGTHQNADKDGSGGDVKTAQLF